MALFTAEAESIGRERLEVRPSHLLSSSVSTLTICKPINAYLCQSYINPCHCIYQSSPCGRILRSQTSRRCSQDEPQPSSGFLIIWLLLFFLIFHTRYLSRWLQMNICHDIKYNHPLRTTAAKKISTNQFRQVLKQWSQVSLWNQFAITPRQHYRLNICRCIGSIGDFKQYINKYWDDRAV